MKLLIIGSGLMGTTAAYFLRRQGHAVTVLDRAEGPAMGASFANGAMLTPSMAEPWNSPGIWRVLLASLGRSNTAVKLHLRALPALLSWGSGFLKNSRVAAFERNARSNLQLALHSLEIMRRLRREVDFDYGHSVCGTLRIFRHSEALEQARIGATQLVARGLSLRVLSRVQTLELEPALQPIASDLVGGIHYEADEAGDAYRFCAMLAEQARREGVTFHFDTDVHALEIRSGRIKAALTERERFVADKYIVAAGSYSAPLLRRSGVCVPVRPVKGYSLTFDDVPPENKLRIPVVDDGLHAAVVPLRGGLRVAGTAEFAGYDLTLSPARIRNLLMLLQAVLPRVQCDGTSARSWCGLRPVSADGVPLIGATCIDNLFLNTGHGHLGWTLAAGSAQLLAELIDGKPLSIDPAPYDPRRFATRPQREG